MTNTTLPLRILLTRDDLVTLYAAINELCHDRNDTIRALVDCKNAGLGIDEPELERLKDERFQASMVRIKLYKKLHSEPITEPLRARLHEMLLREPYPESL